MYSSTAENERRRASQDFPSATRRESLTHRLEPHLDRMSGFIRLASPSPRRALRSFPDVGITCHTARALHLETAVPLLITPFVWSRDMPCRSYEAVGVIGTFTEIIPTTPLLPSVLAHVAGG